ncbi:hypothetical protein FKR81_00065 [Lentzea tibetensis]|uniref:ARB-07466-like C-terminal domain-containing protein n=1 Tax=Lentzea tibetensis TaxID=2591470 RepID=A0A563F2P1_9PSEU|nr:hypothetical protein [Lentzea tibetensis]TWP54008.1 hypothetical protein FKR81_00065 [Lentzea tibetensis]
MGGALAGAVPAGAAVPPVDSYQSYVRPQCRPHVEQPGVMEFRDMIISRMGGHNDGIHACTGHEHGEGRAWDWRMSAANPGDAKKVQDVLDWLLATDLDGTPHAMARRLGIGNIIWNRRSISLWSHENKVWGPYDGEPHTDHVHFAFSWPGARRETSWFRAAPKPAEWYPNGGAQVLVSTTSGGLFHNVRFGTGAWQGFDDVKRRTKAVLTPVDVASAMVGGEQHALVAGADTELWHAIRRSDGSWTPFGNVEDFAGEVGYISRVTAADVQGALHVVAVVGGEHVLHTVRSPNGAWTPLHNLEVFAGQVSGVVDVAAAGFANGEFQLSISLTDGRLLHTLRRIDGSWTAWGDVEAATHTNPGAPRSLAATSIDGTMHLVADYGPNDIRHTVRYTHGGWEPLRNINQENQGNTGVLADVAASGSTNGELQVLAATSSGPVWHAIRRTNGSWTWWGDTGTPGRGSRVSIAIH